MSKDQQRLENLLKSGEENKRLRNDRKSYVTLDDVRFLIEQGAVIENNNLYQTEGVYLHEVVWQDELWYVTTTAEKVDFKP